MKSDEINTLEHFPQNGLQQGLYPGFKSELSKNVYRGMQMFRVCLCVKEKFGGNLH